MFRSSDLARGPSSPELKANVTCFLERVEQIADNPLARQDSQFKVQLGLNTRTGDVRPPEGR